ncbi:MAG: ABC-F family ATP-binding cassette domain-containing protein [Peptostreptococcaceae bacterium]|nr:ABC-F family ATP-binding cassette domain-containing protein [Peptostreptococcaceae bacterium]
MITLSVNNLKKSYGIDTIIENISFAVNENEKVGIVGPNGAGKTTLFKIISGEIEKDDGQIFWGKDIRFGYLEQNVSTHSEATIWDEVLTIFADVIALEKELRRLENEIATKHDSPEFDKLMNEYATKSDRFDAINGFSYKSEATGILLGLGFSEQDFTKELKLLSGGEKTRLMLSKLLLKKPDVLLLDEPTNHLDTKSVEWLESYLKQYRGNVFIISHDRYFLDKTVDTIMEIQNKNLTIYPGNYTDYTYKRDILRAQLEKQYKENQEEIQRQRDIIAQLRAFGREKQVKRARSREKLLGKMEVIEKPHSIQKKASIRFTPSIVSGYEVMHAKELAKAFEQRVLFENLSFDIFRGEKVALIGPNGIGKTTLFNILLGKDADFSGQIQFGTNVNPLYFDQTRSDLNPSNSILDEVWNAYPHLNQTSVRNYLAAFLFTGEEVFKPIGSLSGGEQARISLLKLMLSKGNFLFLDEPTNHLDIDSKEVLELALSAYEGTIFFISHDRYFVNALADRIIEFSPEGVREFLGNYDDYQYTLQTEREEKEKRLAESMAPTNKTQQKQQYKKEKEKVSEQRRLKNAIKSAEETIAALEKELEKIDELMCLEEIYSDPQKSLDVMNQKTEAENKLDKAMQEWEEYHLALEEYFS